LGILGYLKIHAEWTHWVDSKTLYHEPPIVDAGDMYPVTETRDLEKGSMPNPATGVDTEYEEVWDDMLIEVPDLGSKKSATCLIFLTEDAEKETKGCIMKLGSWCQCVLRVGKDISAERWKFTDEYKSWVLVARVGKNSTGCEVAFGDDESMEVGKTIEADGRKWSVKEANWSS
jgi:Protein HRI1